MLKKDRLSRVAPGENCADLDELLFALALFDPDDFLPADYVAADDFSPQGRTAPSYGNSKTGPHP